MKNNNLPKKRNKEMKTKSTKQPKVGPQMTTRQQSKEELSNANDLLNKAKEQRKPVKVLPRGVTGDYRKNS